MTTRRKFLQHSFELLGFLLIAKPTAFALNSKIETITQFRVKGKSTTVGAKVVQIKGKHLLTIRDLNGKTKIAYSFNPDSLERTLKRTQEKNTFTFTKDGKEYKFYKKGVNFFTDYPDTSIPEPPSSQFLGVLLFLAFAFAAAMTLGSIECKCNTWALLDQTINGQFKLEPDLEEEPNIWY